MCASYVTCIKFKCILNLAIKRPLAKISVPLK